MTLSEVIALAKAGYKKSDIEKMLNTDPEPGDKPEPQGAEPEQAEDSEGEPDTPGNPEPQDDNEPDYKALYEEAQKKLVEAQKNNSKQDQGKDDNIEKLETLFDDFCNN